MLDQLQISLLGEVSLIFGAQACVAPVEIAVWLKTPPLAGEKRISAQSCDTIALTVRTLGDLRLVQQFAAFFPPPVILPK